MMTSRSSCDFPAQFQPRHKPKMNGDCYAFKFLQHSVDEKHLMRFRNKNAVFKFLHRSAGLSAGLSVDQSEILMETIVVSIARMGLR